MRCVRSEIRPVRGGAELDGWRVGCLRHAGFGRVLAERLVLDGRYDLHALLLLVDRGCSPELAARILAPLDQGEQH